MPFVVASPAVVATAAVASVAVVAVAFVAAAVVAAAGTVAAETDGCHVRRQLDLVDTANLVESAVSGGSRIHGR